MLSAAARAFESALQRDLPDTSVPAVGQFETLLKARRKSVENASPEPLGLGTGAKDTSFEAANPFALHGKSYKPVNQNGTMLSVGEDHPSFNAQHLADVKPVKVNNEFEPLMRKGYEMHQKLGSMSEADRKVAMTGYEHPNHDYHLAYVYKLAKNSLDPNSTVNKAARAKKAGGLSTKEQKEAMASAVWHVDNRNEKADTGLKATEMPRSHHETVTRIEQGGVSGLDAAGNARNAVVKYGRGAGFVAHMNRMFSAAKKLGSEKFNQMSGEEFTNYAREHGHLSEFSQTRLVPGFTAEHLGAKGKKAHNPAVKADFDKNGKPTAGPMEWFRGSAGGEGARSSHNLGEEMGRLKTKPVIDGRTEAGKKAIKEHGLRIYHDYVTPAMKTELDKHTRMFGGSV